MEIIGRGAEAIIKRINGKVEKERIKKGYRLKELDEKLRKERTKIEARIMEKLLSKGVNVPKVLNKTDFVIEMEFIDGEKLSNIACENKELMKKLGEQVALMHEAKVYHGDLTTSNAIVKNNNVFLIDFGLSNHSQKIEDYAVDLHVLKQSIESKHYKCMDELWQYFLNGYKKFSRFQEVLDRLIVVESRGRYKGKKKNE